MVFKLNIIYDVWGGSFNLFFPDLAQYSDRRDDEVMKGELGQIAINKILMIRHYLLVSNSEIDIYTNPLLFDSAFKIPLSTKGSTCRSIAAKSS